MVGTILQHDLNDAAHSYEPSPALLFEVVHRELFDAATPTIVVEDVIREVDRRVCLDIVHLRLTATGTSRHLIQGKLALEEQLDASTLIISELIIAEESRQQLIRGGLIGPAVIDEWIPGRHGVELLGECGELRWSRCDGRR